MGVTGLDHVNIRTGRLAELTAWYRTILGAEPGPRPDFGFPGAWLYIGGSAVIHLVGVDDELRAGRDLTLEHYALRATGFGEFRSLLEREGVPHTVDPVPGTDIVQINLRDPDGNHLHVDFTDAG